MPYDESVGVTLLSRYKIGLLIVSIISIFALIVLSSSLSNLEFRQSGFSVDEISAEMQYFISLFQTIKGIILLVAFLMGLMFIIWSVFLRPKSFDQPSPKGKYVFLIQILLWVAVFLILRRRLVDRQISLFPMEMESNPAFSSEQALLIAPVPMPNWLPFLSSVILILSFLLLLMIIYRRSRKPKVALTSIAQEAQRAIESIKMKEDLRGVIIRCYYNMVQILHKKRGIQRKHSMTPREFEHHLENLGLPTEPVQQLTLLFEVVRYGNKELDEKADLRAISCLEEIVRFDEGSR